MVGQTRNKSTAALMEETDSDVGRGAMVDAGTGDGGSLTSFRLTGEQPGYKHATSVFKRVSKLNIIEAAALTPFYFSAVASTSDQFARFSLKF